jgi:biopolymer transport protein ExbD
MKFSRFVCLIAAISAMFSTPGLTGQTSAMRQGVSVQLTSTSNAVAFPDADNEDAWIIAVTADGRLYFGVKPVTPEQLRQEMKTTPRHRDSRLYIKADASAPFAAVKQALLAAHELFFETVVLLTQEPQNVSSARLAQPHGLEVSIALPSAKATLLQLRDSGSLNPEVKVDDQDCPWSELRGAMAQASAGRGRKIVVIEAEEGLSAARLISAIDLCRSIGANVAISLIGS